MVGTSVAVDAAWYAKHMNEAISRIDWRAAVQDVQRFLPLREQDGLQHWNADLFNYHLKRVVDHSG